MNLNSAESAWDEGVRAYISALRRKCQNFWARKDLLLRRERLTSYEDKKVFAQIGASCKEPNNLANKVEETAQKATLIKVTVVSFCSLIWSVLYQYLYSQRRIIVLSEWRFQRLFLCTWNGSTFNIKGFIAKKNWEHERAEMPSGRLQYVVRIQQTLAWAGAKRDKNIWCG